MNWLLILIIAAFGYFMWMKNPGKSWQKIAGLSLVFLSIVFIEFTPDPLSFGAFALTHGIEMSSINASNISLYLWDYEVWSITLGVLFLVVGGYLLNWSPKKVWEKLDIGKYKISLMIAVSVVLIIALLNIWYIHSGLFGSFFVNNSGIGSLFFKFAPIILVLPAIFYYFLVHKDKSEALGIFLFSLIIYLGGLADVSFYIFQKIPLPAEIPGLVGSHFINFVSTKLLGYPTVTNVSLLVSVLISFVLAWIVAKILKEKF